MEQNRSEQGSLMWPLWGSPAVGLVFNQAPGFNSQQAPAPLTPHHLWRVEFTEPTRSIISYLSLSSLQFSQQRVFS